MKGFEFLHNITVGQYLPRDSVVHRLHPATKMLSAALLVTALIISASLTGLVVTLFALLAGFAVAQISVAYAIRGLKPAIPILVLIAVLQILFVSGGESEHVIWQAWIIRITPRSFLIAGLTALRLVVLILVITLFTLCTSSRELTHGTERLLRPLSRIGFPAHELSMVVTIALRFLPILAEEAEHLVKAQVSRGADFGRGRSGLFKRLFRMMPLLVPLFIASLRRGEVLAQAMAARCYSGSAGRSQLVRFERGRADLFAYGGTAVLCAAILVSHFARLDMRVWAVLVRVG